MMDVVEHQTNAGRGHRRKVLDESRFIVVILVSGGRLNRRQIELGIDEAEESAGQRCPITIGGPAPERQVEAARIGAVGSHRLRDRDRFPVAGRRHHGDQTCRPPR